MSQIFFNNCKTQRLKMDALCKGCMFLVLFCLIFTHSRASTYEFSGVSEKDSQFVMNRNQALINDNDGNIFMMYDYRRGLSPNPPKAAKWDGEQLRFFSEYDSLPYGVVRNIMADDDKGVWLASDEGLVYYHDEQFDHYPLPEANKGSRKISRNIGNKPLIKDKDGYIWAFMQRFEQEDTYTEGFSENSFLYGNNEYSELWKFKNGQWTQYEMDFFNTNSIVLTRGTEGELVIALRKYDGSSWIRQRYHITHDDKEVIDRGGIQDFKNGSVIYSHSNSISLGNRLMFSYNPIDLFENYTAYEGFSILDPQTETWEHFGAPGFENEFDYNTIPYSAIGSNGIARDNWATTLQHDKHKQGIWIGNRNDFYPDNQKNGGGLIWFYYGGNCDNVFKRYSPEIHDFIETVAFGPGRNVSDPEEEGLRRITGIAYDPDGNLWVGTRTEGLFSIPKEELPEPPDTSVSAPEQISLNSPANQATEIYPDTLLNFDPADKAESYRLQLAKDPGFEEIVIDTSTTNTQVATPEYLDNETQYFWRVKGKNLCHEGHWSKTNEFKTVLVTPEQVALSAPEDGATEIPVDTSLTWESTIRADSYQLQVAKGFDFEEKVLDTTIEQLSFKIIDKLEAYTIYYWRVRGINYDIPGKQEQHVKGPWSSRRAFATQPPTSLLQPLSDKGFSLYQNKPNPFAQETEISYNIPENEKVTLDIIDIRGNTIKNLVHEEQPAGKHSIIFSPANLPPGLYFYRLHAGEHSESKRMILE